MPKSKLRSSISIDEIDSIQATREKVSVESITVNNRIVKRPKFLRAQISPRFRAVGSIETDEVEYDTYVKWAITIPTGWAKEYQYNNTNLVNWSGPLTDSGILTAGETVSETSIDAYLAKFDLNGNPIWFKKYGGSGFDRGLSIFLDDDSIMLAGSTYFGAGGFNIMVIKTDLDGNPLWARAYGTQLNSHAYALTRVSDGVIIKASGENGPALVKLDFSGNIQWAYAYPKDAEERQAIPNFVQLDDGFVVGDAYKLSGEYYRCLLVKTDLDGNLLWAKTYDAGLDFIIYNTRYDGENLVHVGFINGKAVLVKTDKDGNLLWAKTYGPTYVTENILNTDFLICDFNGYVAGYPTGTGNTELIVIKTDISGNVQLAKKYTFAQEIPVSVKMLKLTNNRYLLLISSPDQSTGLYYLVLMTIDNNLNITSETITTEDITPEVQDITSQIIVTDATLTATDISSQMTITDIASQLQVEDITSQIVVTEL